uniref:Uncharacterized protein n=1 Tax=Glossina austeni TaxID=7395 RepID=A0A1A9UIT3_GLOAU
MKSICSKLKKKEANCNEIRRIHRIIDPSNMSVILHTSNLHSVEILAILLANSCIQRKGLDNSSVHFMVSADFSSHTKQESNATVCGVVKSLKTPLNIISVTNSSSAELSSQATRPLNSITSAAVQYSMRRKTRLRCSRSALPWTISRPTAGDTFSSIIRITIPLSSRPRRPARPAICMYSPEDIQRKSLPSNLRGAKLAYLRLLIIVLGTYLTFENTRQVRVKLVEQNGEYDDDSYSVADNIARFAFNV